MADDNPDPGGAGPGGRQFAGVTAMRTCRAASSLPDPRADHATRTAVRIFGLAATSSAHAVRARSRARRRMTAAGPVPAAPVHVTTSPLRTVAARRAS